MRPRSYTVDYAPPRPRRDLIGSKLRNRADEALVAACCEAAASGNAAVLGHLVESGTHNLAPGPHNNPHQC